MGNLSDIKFYLSGTDGTTGGAKGASQILSQSSTAPTTITGVTVLDAYGNKEGAGTLTYTASTQTLAWASYGGALGTPVDVSADGNYAIQTSNNGGTIVVSVVSSSLPGSNTTNTLTIAALDNQIFDDVTADESDVGVVRYRCIYFCNTGATKTKSNKLWISSNTPGEDVISIGLDPAGAGGTAATIADENTAPAGVTFSGPTSQATALDLGELQAGQDYPFWIRETVPPEVTTAYEDNPFSLGFSSRVQ